MKKRIALFLTVLLLLGCLPITAGAAGFTEKKIFVNCMGVVSSISVLQTGSGDLLVPLSWITQLDPDMTYSEKNNVRTYYDKSQKKEKRFARRLFIDMKEHSFIQGIYMEAVDNDFWGELYASYGMMNAAGPIKDTTRVHKNYYPICQDKFDNWVKYSDDIWVNMEQLLGLIDVKAEISKEGGTLCIYPIETTVFDALYKHNDKIPDLLFDADELYAKDVMTTGGWIVSSVGDLRLDRLDFVSSSGRINDYESVFTAYLLDNETYLKTFEIEKSGIQEFFSKHGTFDDAADEVGNASILYSLVPRLFDGSLKPVDEEIRSFWKVINPKAIKNCPEFFSAFSTTLDVSMALMEYGDAYLNQVDDHRLMLNAVYNYNSALKGEPSYKAAQTVSEIYGENAAESTELLQESFRDMYLKIYKGVIKDVVDSKVKSWFLAVELTKVFCAEDYDYVANCALMNLIDNTISYSQSIYEKRLRTTDFSAEDLNNLRLSILMSLVGSRYAFKTYYSEEMPKVAEIDLVLADLYKAGANSEYGASDTYETVCKNLKQNFRHLDEKKPEDTASSDIPNKDSNTTSDIPNTDHDTSSDTSNGDEPFYKPPQPPQISEEDMKKAFEERIHDLVQMSYFDLPNFSTSDQLTPEMIYDSIFYYSYLENDYECLQDFDPVEEKDGLYAFSIPAMEERIKRYFGVDMDLNPFLEKELENNLYHTYDAKTNCVIRRELGGWGIQLFREVKNFDFVSIGGNKYNLTVEITHLYDKSTEYSFTCSVYYDGENCFVIAYNGDGLSAE